MKSLIISLALIASVHDGDTIKLTDGRTVRLEGIDAPEISQPYGIESRNLLRKLTQMRKVKIVSQGRDRYGRMVGEIFVGRRSVNHVMVSRGAAWWYRSFAPNDFALQSMEAKARNRHLGLWQFSNNVAPWDWRKYYRNNHHVAHSVKILAGKQPSVR